MGSDYIAPARWQYRTAHLDAGDGTTVCGLDTTDPEWLWQPVPASEATPCPACLGQQPEELTLL